MKYILSESQYKKILEYVDFKQVICDRCGWRWSLLNGNGGDDPYICHKCFHNNEE